MSTKQKPPENQIPTFKPSKESGGAIIELTITDLSRGGAGIGQEESGRMVFVPLTAPGDRVRARIWKEKKRYAHADLLEVLKPSELRVEPACPAFGRCGGCEWQHLPYSLQWKTKTEGVRHALNRVGVKAPDHFEEFPASEPFGYRNRIQLRGNREELGFYARRSHEIVAISSCPIARPEINRHLDHVRKKGGALENPYKVEISVTPLASAARIAPGSEEGPVHESWNRAHAALGFHQINDAQNDCLKKWIGGKLTPSRVLLDLYGGNGNLSLPLAAVMKRVFCVDFSSPRQKPPQTPENLTFHAAPVLPWLKKAQRSHPELMSKEAKSAILDPPREGLASEGKEILRLLARMQVTEAVAVGCNADAWAADLVKWVEAGWEVKDVAIFDFFPQTAHVEAAAYLVRSPELQVPAER